MIDSPPIKVVREFKANAVTFAFQWRISGQRDNRLNIIVAVGRKEIEQLGCISDMSDAFLSEAYKMIDEQPIELHNRLIDDFQRFATHYEWERLLLSGPPR